MSEYTEGPWSVRDNPDFPGVLHLIWADGRDGFKPLVGRTCYAPQSKANARLIAAAPDLMWALKELLGSLPKNRGWLSPDLEKIARETVKQATGETE